MHAPGARVARGRTPSAPFPSRGRPALRRLLPPALVLLLVVTVAWVLPAFGPGAGNPQAIVETSVRGKSWAPAVTVPPGTNGVGIGKDAGGKL
ncbi:MAG: hypothetical protein FJ296_07440 [Planctomycetes bacterium]|nr:hypothetical protein [Planctomycetota bacterium]